MADSKAYMNNFWDTMKDADEHIKNIAKKEHEKNLFSKSELSIWLDRYDDIFSGFDPSPYAERTLSDVFLHEVRKHIHERDPGKVQLRLLLPETLHDRETETVVIRHLHAHFKYETLQLIRRKRKIAQNGWLLTLWGLLVTIRAAWPLNFLHTNFTITVLRSIVEPAGWFKIWTEQIFYTTQKIKPDYSFIKE